jgi:hypothetical protein
MQLRRAASRRSSSARSGAYSGSTARLSS